jgi:hypothetical protein
MQMFNMFDISFYEENRSMVEGSSHAEHHER